MVLSEQRSGLTLDQSLMSTLELGLPELDEVLFSPPEILLDMFDNWAKGKSSEEKLDVPTTDDKNASRRPEEFPEDIRAFFGHPLTAATTAVNGDALALLHEFNNLPVIERSEEKSVETNDLFNAILREENGNSKSDWENPVMGRFLCNPKNVSQQEEDNTKLGNATDVTELTSVKSEQKPSCCLDASSNKPVEGTDAESLSLSNVNETTKKMLFDKIQRKRHSLNQSGSSPDSCLDAQELEVGSVGKYPIKKDGFLTQLTDDVTPSTDSPCPEVFSQNQRTDAFNVIDESCHPYDWSAAVTTCQQAEALVDTSKSNDFFFNNFPQAHYTQQQCYTDPVMSVPKYAELTNYSPLEPYGGLTRCCNHGEQFSNFHSHSRASIDYNSKSPDSGIGDSCTSPVDSQVSYQNPLSYNPMPDAGGREKGLKRRRPSTASVRQICYQNHKQSSLFSGTTIPKLEFNTTGYKYTLESPTSTSQRIDEDRMTYLNKGQFYNITFENINRERTMKKRLVRSVISIVFRDDKTIDEELKAWEFWHSRQHSLKQRVLDIDTKNSEGIQGNYIEELSLNCVAVKWDPSEGPAKLSLCVNCLSTDFSNQKGVKGLPLHIQIDTYEDMRTGSFPVHRSYCQIKVFCDKGAERKTRDEEKRKDCKDKQEPRSPSTNGRRRMEDMFHPPCDRSEFYAMADLQTRPLLFNPPGEMFRQSCASPVVTDIPLQAPPQLTTSGDCVPSKRQRMESFHEPEKVLLYVREKAETVFTGLLLVPPTLTGLAHAIQEKYGIAPNQMKTIYKRSKKGILVKLDDNIIKHYSDESTFVIEIEKVENTTDFEITLAEIDVEKS